MGINVNIGGNVIEILLTASIALMAAVFLAVFSSPVMAKVTGPCANCHTMHNSQGGTNMQTGYSPGSEPQATLLRANGCLGCHGASDGATWQGVGGAPVVFNAGEPTFNATKGLAGGNFYWVSPAPGPAIDSQGHNVFSGNPDSLTEAPGRTEAGFCSNSCHHNFDTAYSGGTGLDGRQGCTGCHMVDDDDGPKGFHHADDSATVIDSFPWYRFLKGHSTANSLGVTGIEDDDWQYETDVDHNEYRGYLGNKTFSYALSVSNNTMTGFCCGCHNNFHVQNTEVNGSGDWVRHPSDAVIPNEGEYAAYTTYDPIAPVARPALSSYDGTSNTVVSGTDMVMCLSCHRPHGSPYPDMLRWDYTTMNAGGGGSGGCFICHTNKDDA